MFVEFVLKGGEHIVKAAFFARGEVFAAFAVVVTSAVTVVAAGVLVELLTACIFAVVFSLALFGELGFESACLLDRKVDALFVEIDADNLDFYRFADAKRLAGMLDEAVGNFGNMHESVVMNADIHKRAEVDYVTNGSR